MKWLSAGLQSEARLLRTSGITVEPSGLSVTHVVVWNLDADHDAFRELGLQSGILYCHLVRRKGRKNSKSVAAGTKNYNRNLEFLSM